MFAITGVEGKINTGAAAVDVLLAAGQKVRIVTWDPAIRNHFSHPLLEITVGEPDDGDFLCRAFTGAKAAYVTIPQRLYQEDFREFQDRTSDACAEALRRSGVSYVVTLSALGAQHAQGTGVVLGFRKMEERIDNIPGIDALHVRAGHFVENLGIEILPSMNLVHGVISPEIPLPIVDPRDVGTFVAHRLLQHDFSGKQTRELLGERDLTMKDVARIVGSSVGSPNMKYLQLPLFQVEQLLPRLGIPRSSAASVIETWKAVNQRMCDPTESRSADNTTLTSLEDLALAAQTGVRKQRADAGV